MKSFSEKLAAKIVKHCTTVGALRAFCEKENVTYEAALEGALEDKINTLIDNHVSPDSWLDFLDAAADSGKFEQAVLDKMYDIAVESWRRGYIAGFSDRNILG